MLQICKNRRWHSVCDRFWDCNDAKVACRQLGFNQEGIGWFTLSQNGLYLFIYLTYIHQQKHLEKHLEKDLGMVLGMILAVSSHYTMPTEYMEGVVIWIMLNITALDQRIVYQSAHSGHKIAYIIDVIPLLEYTVTVFQQSQNVRMMMSVLLAVVDHMKEDWRCVTMGSGHQHAASVQIKLVGSVNDLDICVEQVRSKI